MSCIVKWWHSSLISKRCSSLWKQSLSHPTEIEGVSGSGSGDYGGGSGSGSGVVTDDGEGDIDIDSSPPIKTFPNKPSGGTHQPTRPGQQPGGGRDSTRPGDRPPSGAVVRAASWTLVALAVVLGGVMRQVVVFWEMGNFASTAAADAVVVTAVCIDQRSSPSNRIRERAEATSMAVLPPLLCFNLQGWGCSVQQVNQRIPSGSGVSRGNCVTWKETEWETIVNKWQLSGGKLSPTLNSQCHTGPQFAHGLDLTFVRRAAFYSQDCSTVKHCHKDSFYARFNRHNPATFRLPHTSTTTRKYNRINAKNLSLWCFIETRLKAIWCTLIWFGFFCLLYRDATANVYIVWCPLFTSCLPSAACWCLHGHHQVQRDVDEHFMQGLDTRCLAGGPQQFDGFQTPLETLGLGW